MKKLKIPKNNSGITKTIRIPENIEEEIQELASMKDLSFNKVVVALLEFGLDNLDESDAKKLRNKELEKMNLK